MKRLIICCFASMVLLVSWAHAQLTIEITQGQDNPTPIAVVPFQWSGGKPQGESITGIVNADLRRSGIFAPLAQKDMLSFPSTYKDVFFRDWRAVGADDLVIGRVSPNGDQSVSVQYELIDVYRQQRMLHRQLKGGPNQLRDLGHRIADEIYRKLTGVKGIFSTRLLYVSVKRSDDGRQTYRLMVTDADGMRERVILQSGQPILSPTWSPDGREIAYVSFETSKPAIYLQELATGKRERLTDFPGLNSAPAFSPDGRKLAMVLSKDGNPDIYVMDLATHRLKHVVDHYAIDTEPDWMPDGRSIIFTSDRGGAPQIYKLTLATGNVERLTFQGSYNARAQVLPDGSGMVMVHRQEGVFHIAYQDLKTGDVRILSQTFMDESPTVSPNGRMVMYATQYKNRGILGAVSIDGHVKYRLPSVTGDVREPAWSPFLGAH